MTCELCGSSSEVKYGTGRFCSSKCARGFSSKDKRAEINAKVSLKLKGRSRPAISKESRKRANLSISETWLKRLLESDFESLSDNSKKRRLIYESRGACNTCGIDSWMNLPISLQMDHIDGNNRDSSRGNLRVICPNCHSQTDTYCGKNRIGGNGRYKKSDEEFVAALEVSSSISEALKKLDFVSRTKFYYERCRRLIAENNLEVSPK